ncbi:MAG: type II toxin-antitoxin system HicB family antitoxin [Waterburya sp.]
MKIKAIIWQEDGVWCASVPALPGCHTWGETYEQLLEMLEDAVQGWLEVATINCKFDGLEKMTYLYLYLLLCKHLQFLYPI